MSNKMATFTSYAAVIFAIIVFIIIGTDDFVKLSSYMEKVVTINFSVLIGYAALVAAIAGIASHNTINDPKLKKEFIAFLYATIINVLVNLVNLLVSFVLTSNDVNFICRLVIGISISSIVALSHSFFKLVNKLIY